MVFHTHLCKYKCFISYKANFYYFFSTFVVNKYQYYTIYEFENACCSNPFRWCCKS